MIEDPSAGVGQAKNEEPAVLPAFLLLQHV